MKKLLTLSLLSLSLLASCSKGSDNDEVLPAANTWTVDGSVYPAINVNATSGFLTAETNVINNGITFYFYNGVIPTTSRTYKLVRKAAAADQISFGVLEIKGGTQDGAYYSADGQDINVRVNVSAAGKLSLTMPKALVTNESGGINRYVSANLAQQ